MRCRAILAVSVLTAAACAGCTLNGPGGALETISIKDPPRRFPLHSTTFVYDHEHDAEISFFLSDHGADAWMRGAVQDGQFLHLVVLWEPKPGATPMDRTATNATLRLILIARGEVGIYEGGGFALLQGRPGRERLTVSIRDASLKLAEATGGFRDLLSPAGMSGSFTAELDRSTARRYRFGASQFVTNVFGESRFVRIGPEAHRATLASAALP